MPMRLGACLLLLLIAAGPAAGDTRPLVAPVEKTVRVRLKKVDAPVWRNHGTPAVLAPGTLEVGGVAIEIAQGKRDLLARWTAEGKAREEKLKKAGGHRLLLRSGPTRCLYVFRDRLGVWHHAPGESQRFEVRGVKFEVFDADHDGVWFEPEQDLIRREGDEHAVPLRTPHVVEDWTLTCGAFDAARKTLDVTLAPIDAGATPEERGVLTTLNRERERMGLLGTTSVEEYARPMRAHAEWMAIHAKVQHEEVPGTKGYTKAGHEAGGAGVILTHPQHVPIATYVDIDSPIHGHVLTMPEFVRSGCGAVRAKDKVVYGGIWTMELHGFKHASVESARFPAVWPPHMATNVPRSWTTEGEDPRPPEDRSREQGYPIRVYLTPGVVETAKFAELTVTLFEQGKEKEPLDCFVIAPDRDLPYTPSPYLRHLLGVLRPIFILPRPVLKADTWHVLRLEGVVDDQPLRHETAFRTGTLRGQYRDLKVGDKRIGR